jgi:hypothetical protein
MSGKTVFDVATTYFMQVILLDSIIPTVQANKEHEIASAIYKTLLNKRQLSVHGIASEFKTILSQMVYDNIGNNSSPKFRGFNDTGEYTDLVVDAESWKHVATMFVNSDTVHTLIRAAVDKHQQKKGWTVKGVAQYAIQDVLSVFYMIITKVMLLKDQDLSKEAREVYEVFCMIVNASLPRGKKNDGRPTLKFAPRKPVDAS